MKIIYIRRRSNEQWTLRGARRNDPQMEEAWCNSLNTWVLESSNTQILQYLIGALLLGVCITWCATMLFVWRLWYRMCDYAACYAFCIPTLPRSLFTMSDRTQLQLFGWILSFKKCFGPQRRYSFQICAIWGIFEPIATIESDRFSNEPNYG